jgi:methyltransferase
MTALGLAAMLVFVPMACEAARAARNERAQRARGGVEPPDDVYTWMRIVYPLMFAAMLLEGVLRGAPSGGALGVGLVVFALGKAIKWWAIAALGPYWTFRVIVVPGAPLVVAGPYRYVRHPNYLGIAGEIVGAALMTGAVVSGVLATVVFGGLLAKRMSVEERALARPS